MDEKIYPINEVAADLIDYETRSRLFNYKEKLEDYYKHIENSDYNIFENVEFIINLLDNRPQNYINIDSIIKADSTQFFIFNWFDTTQILPFQNRETVHLINSINLSLLSKYLCSTIVIDELRIDPHYLLTNTNEYTICKGDTLNIALKTILDFSVDDKQIYFNSNEYEISRTSRSSILKFVPSKEDKIPNTSNKYFKTVDLEMVDVGSGNSFVFEEPVYVWYKLVDCDEE